MVKVGAVARRVARRIIDQVSAPIGSLVAVRTGEPLVAMTFDDGPDEMVTPRVLEALERTGSTATFFVLLSRVRRHPNVLQSVAAAGHEIALHGPDHRRLTDFSAAELKGRITQARNELEQVIGGSVRWYRPPYGAQSLASWRAIRGAGMTPVFWGPSTWDWRPATAEQRLARAISGVGPGAIVLAHDGFADQRDGVDPAPDPELDRAAWAEEVIGHYARRGLGCTSIGRLVEAGRPKLVARFGR